MMRDDGGHATGRIRVRLLCPPYVLLRTWRIAHMSLAVVIVIASVVHGLLVEGTMETASKAVLCALVLGATIKVMADLRRKRAASRGPSIAGQKP
jgi:predicted ferric reductase